MKLLNLIKKKFAKNQPVKTGDYLVDYYNNYDEDSRLLSKHGRIEFLTTVKYVEKYLKYHFKTCERQDLIGLSHHTLDVLRKE